MQWVESCSDTFPREKCFLFFRNWLSLQTRSPLLGKKLLDNLTNYNINKGSVFFQECWHSRSVYNDNMVEEDAMVAEQSKWYAVLGENPWSWKYWTHVKTTGVNSVTDVKHKVQWWKWTQWNIQAWITLGEETGTNGWTAITIIQIRANGTRMMSVRMTEAAILKTHNDGLNVGDEGKRIASESQLSDLSKGVYSGTIYKRETAVRKTNCLGGWAGMSIKHFILDNVMLRLPVRHPREVNKANSRKKLCREVWDAGKICMGTNKLT